ncbi:MAG: FkbM family methyltransferase [Microgenomates group bacterium]
MKKTAIFYYLTSFKNIILNFNFGSIFFLLFNKKTIIKIKKFSFICRNLMDVWTVKEVVYDHCYEKLKKIKKNDVVIDIGASIGDFSILASKKGAKKIYAVEMDNKAINIMKENIKLNQAKNIFVIQKKLNSLDYLFNQYKIKNCHFLKVDCEGWEYKIFKNATLKTLKKINYFAIEIHLFNKKMFKNYLLLKKKLKKAGLILKEIDNPVHNYLKFLFAMKKT